MRIYFKENSTCIDKLLFILMLIYKRVEYMKIVVCRQFFPKCRVLDMTASAMLITKQQCSVSRFGDGELNQVLSYLQKSRKNSDIGFQKYSPELGKMLYEVLMSNEKNHFVTLPYCLIQNSKIELKKESKSFWRHYAVANYYKIGKLLDRNKIYLDTSISRFYMGFKSSTHCNEHIAKLKEIWNGRRLLVVEGEFTRLGVGNDLFDNVKSIERILCPAKNAFSIISQIKETVIEYVQKNTPPHQGYFHLLFQPSIDLNEEIENADQYLVLLALGPTATILAYELSKCGIQAFDIGHVDVEYEWFLMGAKNKVAIPGRFVNEVNAQSDCVFDLSQYKSQIVAELL